eukprot:TRINITY_DN10775_c0_g1_i1.p2 TRINITY_DN10775_c0_g1~~TRINITY_DN10775_c0_g1_i1.p2  ORF type:complete len:138 (-),score=27.28 TRINITY_DN10775_c0_g1_i1:24-410(-)
MADTCSSCKKGFGEDGEDGEDAPVVNVGDLSYHPECFNCKGCGLNFITDSEKTGQPYPSEDAFKCGPCFHGTCEKCGLATIGEHLTVQGKTFHKACYDCPKCQKCNKDIYGKYIVVEGLGNLHEECYP